MKGKFKLLYYSTAYHAKHGGSTHSKHFYQAASKHPLIEALEVFPASDTAARTQSMRGRLRTGLRAIPLIQIYFFYRRNRLNFLQLVDAIRLFKPDAVLVRLDSNFLQLAELIKLFPQLVIATEINASPFDESFKNIGFRSHFKKMESDHLSKLQANFFVSDNLRRRVMGQNLRPDRDFVVPNGVDINTFRPALRNEVMRRSLHYEVRDFVVGYIGTLDLHKRIDVLIRAFKIVHEQNPETRLLIVGSGSEYARMIELVRTLELENVVTFTGWVEHGRIPAYLTCLDLAIHHSAGVYMSPLKLFEYMACGLPVIGPNTAAVQEVFEDGEQILLTNGDYTDVAAKMLIGVSNNALRSKISKAGESLVRTKYTWDINANLIITAIYASLKKVKSE